jgi:hypothetical protein
VKEIGGKFFGDQPQVIKALDFIVAQLHEGQKGAYEHFMGTLKPEIVDMRAETQKPQ